MISLLNRFPLILLAAGQSSRMGQPKGLVNYQGRPWILEQLNRYARAGGEQIHLVLGHHVKEYFDEVPLLNQSKRINVVINPQPEKGMFHSLQVALQEIDLSHLEAVFVSPIDVPLPNPMTWHILLQALHSHSDAQACLPYFQGNSGHPVLLKADWAQRLRAIPMESPEARLDFQLNQLPEGAVVRVQVPDAAIIQNLNTPEDFRQFSS